jgi:hypothetical protein
VALAVAVALAATGLAACGDDEEARDELLGGLSAEGFEGIDSGVVDLAFDVDADVDEGDSSVHATLKGPFTGDGRFDLDGALSVHDPSEGQNIDVSGSMTATDDNLYLGSGKDVYELGEELFASINATDDGKPPPDQPDSFAEACRAGMKSAGANPKPCDEIDPSEWIESASDEGTEEVEGVETEHVRGELDVERIARDLIDLISGALPAGQRDSLRGFGDSDILLGRFEDFVDEAAIDVYRGHDDGLTRRIKLTVKISDGGEGASFVLDFSLAGVNEQQQITAPAGAKPIEALLDTLPPPFRSAFDCIKKARTPEDINACAFLVGGMGTGISPI